MKLILSLAVSLLFTVSFAQNRGFRSEGRDFYLGYLRPSYTDVVKQEGKDFHKVYALINSYEDNEVQISYFDQLTKKEYWGTRYKVKARQSSQIELDQRYMRSRDFGDHAGEFKSCHITSQRPISVHFYSTGVNAGGSYLALPVHSWGKNYTVASYADGGNFVLNPDSARGLFMIIAAYDGTEVQITPTARTGGDHWGVNQGQNSTGKPQPYTVGLNRGQTWLVTSHSASLGGTDDISASLVKANKPVAVISGHENADVGDGSSGGTGLEARDYMVEQMIPFEFWDHTGYITIPLPDSPSNNGDGVGSDVLAYVYDAQVPSTIIAKRPGDVVDTPGTYITPPATFSNIVVPAHVIADSGKRFMPIQYDQRNHGTGVPFPAPSMTSIVARNEWRNAYQFYVPTNVSNVAQAYYLTIVAPKDGSTQRHPMSKQLLMRNWYADSILVSLNNGNVGNVNMLGAQKKAFPSIPDHPDLRAVVYQIAPGTTYYIHSPLPFMAYLNGDRALALDGALGDNQDDYYFSYSLPLGAALSDYQMPKRMSVIVDTLCDGWRICALDSNDNGGIRYATLIDDANRDLWPDASRAFTNCTFVSGSDHASVESVANPPKNTICFDISSVDPSKPSYAPVAIFDAAGNYEIVEMRRAAQKVSLTPAIDSVPMFGLKVGAEQCQDFVFVNEKDNQQSYMINQLLLPDPTPFKVRSVSPALPTILNPGDSLQFTVCFTASDTSAMFDTLVFDADCLGLRIPFAGIGTTGLILAEDHDFGNVIVGTRVCHDVEVKNVGKQEFTLTKDWVLQGGGDITFDTTLFNKLPLTLTPGQSHKFNFCYSPKSVGPDQARMTWATTIRSPFETSVKNFSLFNGSGILPGLNWDRIKQVFTSQIGEEVWKRIILVNTGSTPDTLTGLAMSGVDADEFFTVATEFNTNPPTFSGTILVPGDSMWVDVKFKPNLSKFPALRIRHAQLSTSSKSAVTDIKTVELEGIIMTADVAEKNRASGITIRPNPARNVVNVEVELTEAEDVAVTVHDVLGREVAAQALKTAHAGSNTIPLNIRALARGTYTVVLRIGDRIETRNVVIE